LWREEKATRLALGRRAGNATIAIGGGAGYKLVMGRKAGSTTSFEEYRAGYKDRYEEKSRQ
jgi:hypothetical protein